jgi:SAM-dependent methyltransferase
MDNAWVVKVYDLVAGAPKLVHLALRVKLATAAPEFVQVMRNAEMRLSEDPSVLRKLLLSEKKRPVAMDAPSTPERKDAPGEDSSLIDEELDEEIARVASRPLQQSPRTSPRPLDEGSPSEDAATPVGMTASLDESDRDHHTTGASVASAGKRSFFVDTLYSLETAQALTAAGIELYASMGGASLDDTLFSHGKLSRSGRVLDCGSGYGTTAIRAASEFAARVVGLDVSAQAVKMSIDKLAKASLPSGGSVEFHHASLLEPWASSLDHSFDLVVARELLSRTDGKDELIASMARKLRTGGRLALSDIVLGPAAKDDQALVDEVGEQGLNLTSADSLREAVVRAGLIPIVVETADSTKAAAADRRAGERSLQDALRVALAKGDDARSLAVVKASFAMDASRLEAGILNHCVIVAELPPPAVEDEEVHKPAPPQQVSPLLVGAGAFLAVAAVGVGAFIWAHSTHPRTGQRLSLVQASSRALDSVKRWFQ